jgi:hypothetical protein
MSWPGCPVWPNGTTFISASKAIYNDLNTILDANIPDDNRRQYIAEDIGAYTYLNPDQEVRSKFYMSAPLAS